MSEKDKDVMPEDDRHGVALMVDIVSDERAWLMAYAAARATLANVAATQDLVNLACKEADLVLIEFKKRFRPEDEEEEAVAKKEEPKPEKGPDGLPVIPPPSFLKKK